MTPLIVDFDDFQQSEHRLDLLHRLKDANPAFKCTLFAIPGNTNPDWWDTVPEWCELALHGEFHPHPREAEDWTYDKAMSVLTAKPERFVDGFKAPGWQISDDTYRALADLGWWVADQPYNDDRRPDILVHRLGDGPGLHIHGHIPDVCGNGIAETFDMLLHFVSAASEFRFVSEAVAPWRSLVAA